MVSQVSTWLQARTARERRLAAGTAILVLAFAAYQAVLRPVWDARSRAAAELEVAHAYLDQVNSDVRAVHDLARRAGAVEPLDAGGLRTTASAVAVSAGVEILRLQPLDGGVVEFWFEGTEARKLFQWIAAMHQRYGTVVMKADLQRAAAGVGVDARIALQPAPGNE